MNIIRILSLYRLSFYNINVSLHNGTSAHWSSDFLFNNAKKIS